jgi:hypothetical protein
MQKAGWRRLTRLFFATITNYVSFAVPVLKRAIQIEQLGISAHRIYAISFASVYPHYIAKAEKKGRTKQEVDEIICWLTGYSQRGLEAQLKKRTDIEAFIAEAPQLNPSRSLIKGVICGIRVEDIKEPLMQEIRYLDKLIDELAKGKAMEKILRA